MYQVLHVRARAVKNGGNDAIVYVKGHLRCVLRIGGDRTVQGDGTGRPAWVSSAIRVAPVHAQSVRSHLAASAAKAARWLKRLLSLGLSARIISGLGPGMIQALRLGRGSRYGHPSRGHARRVHAGTNTNVSCSCSKHAHESQLKTTTQQAQIQPAGRMLSMKHEHARAPHEAERIRRIASTEAGKRRGRCRRRIHGCGCVRSSWSPLQPIPRYRLGARPHEQVSKTVNTLSSP